jgi:xanthine dehydrogenase molybdopterin-binding subunit B
VPILFSREGVLMNLMPTQKFGVGQPVSRKEDPKLVRGEGRYTDDIDLPGQAYGVMVRSPLAHGRITRLPTDAARAAPGVLGVSERSRSCVWTAPCSSRAAAGVSKVREIVHSPS